jgi:hypothetical protein
LEINEALDGGLFVSVVPLLPLSNGLFFLHHELFEGFLERQGVSLLGDVGLGILVAWRPALLASSCQALAFRVAKARPLAMKVDYIAHRGIVIAFALLLLLELLQRAKLSSHFWSPSR